MNPTVQGQVGSGTLGFIHPPLNLKLMDQRRLLRKQARQARRSLTRWQQQRASQQLAKILCQQPAFIRSKHIALYLANDGEIDPQVILKILWQRGKSCYLPVLWPFSGTLGFALYTPTSTLKRNRFGIPEPRVPPQKMRRANNLCLILMPLVAFDTNGGRLGMGGGFYDKTLAFKHNPDTYRHSPTLIGLAHDCQETSHIPMEPWDIPLDAIATNSRLFCTHSNTKLSKRNFWPGNH